MISQQLYTNIIRPVLFRRDPEDVHNVATKTGVLIGKSLHARALLRVCSCSGILRCATPWQGLSSAILSGLALVFDKNARLWNVLPEIGFGFAELGSITGEPCAGNPRPRLFRVPKEKSIIVNYGLYNEGSEAIAQRMRAARFRIPIGFSVAKTNDPRLSTAEGIQDYRKAFLAMHPFGSYTTINVSCPNTADGQTFGHPENLEPLLKAIAKEIQVKPVFLKIKPDMNKVAMRGPGHSR